VSTYDVVIRGGTVVDGTGAAPRTGDVAIAGDRVVAVGDVDGTGTREIDADGALVTPGWVDIHTHYDGQATWDPHLAPSSWHGVTTVVFGNCGVGFAPVRPSDQDRLVRLMEGVEDIPGTALHEGLPWDWQSFPEYLDSLERRPHDIDLAAQLPHGALRVHVMGDRGADREPATPDDIARMAEIARVAVEAGAIGFTTSRTLNHRTSTGEPTPTLTAAADELAGIAQGLASANNGKGLGVLQVVSDFIDVDQEFANLRRMAEESGRPLSISVAQSPVAPESHHKILGHIATANADGLEVRAQVAPRAVGLLLGLTCTLNPFMINPVYREIRDLPLDDRVAALRDPAFRQRLFDAHTGERDRSKLGGVLISMFDRMYTLGDPPNYEPDPSTSVAARAERAGREAHELALDTMLEDDGLAFLYLPFLNYADGNLDAVREMLLHPNAVPGLSDGGAHVGTICDGSFPTFLLTHWARDRAEGRIPIEAIVQRQCRDTARTVGMLDRGVLAPGYKADVNVIDFERLAVRPPEMRWDLPAGGRRLLQRAEGYRHTFVSGSEIQADGEPTGALPGALVRGAQPAPAAS
jgi:N-acyl-D-aspartate/D-glutamate deacylase